MPEPTEWSWSPGEDLAPFEQTVIEAAAVGKPAGVPEEPPVSREKMQGWGPARTIRAAVLRHLLVEAQWPVHAKGVRLEGVRVLGRLDLEAATLRCPLRLTVCLLDDPESFVVDYASASLLAMTHCHLAGFSGDRLTVTHELDLSHSSFTGLVRLLGADITGTLYCSGAQLTGTDTRGRALDADGLKVGDDVFLDEGFTAAGAVHLPGADITGTLYCSGAQLTGTDTHGIALGANRLKVGGSVVLGEGFTAAGAVRLLGADITGQLSLRGAQLTGTDTHGIALDADWLKVDGSVVLDEGFTAAGAVRLPGADITGQLSLRGAQLTGTDTHGIALAANRLKVDGSVFLDEGFTAAGAVRLPGADITGTLYCSGAQLTGTDTHGIALDANRLKVGDDVFLDEGFTAAGAVRLPGADITGQLSLRGAQLTGTDTHGIALDADRLKVGDDVFLDEGFTAAGAVRLPGADITGQLSLRGAQLTGTDTDGIALAADWLKVGGSVVLDEGFTAAGAVRLLGADITGQLSLRGAQLTGTDTDGIALDADWLKVDGSVVLDEGFTAAGAVRLPGADITGQLSLRGAQLTGTDGIALDADGLKVDGSVFLGEGFTAAGAVRLLGADITGQLSLRGAQLTGTDGIALDANRLKVGDDVFLDEGFTAAGAVRLLGADITGQLSLRGAQLTGTDGIALDANRLKVGDDVFLDEGFTAAGAVRLLGADITGQLSLRGAQLTGTDGIALAADGLKVGGSVFLDEGFTAAGAVLLRAAEVGESCSLSGAVLGEEVALDAQGAHIAHDLVWSPRSPVKGVVNLERVATHQLVDDWSRPDERWPPQGKLHLTGFIYDGFGGECLPSAQQLLAWIRRTHRPHPADKRAKSVFASQPYEQLVRVYRAHGQDTDARFIAIARRNDLRTYGELTWARRVGSRLLDTTIKHGYAPLRAVMMLVAVYLLAVVTLWVAQQHSDLIVPTRNVTTIWQEPTGKETGKEVTVRTPPARDCATVYPCFSPAGFAVDTVIPILNVHQGDSWRVNASADGGWLFVVLGWIGTALGWAFSTLAVLGFTGLVRRE